MGEILCEVVTKRNRSSDDELLTKTSRRNDWINCEPSFLNTNRRVESPTKMTMMKKAYRKNF